MTVAAIERDMRTFAGGSWIGKHALKKYLQCGDAHRDEIIEGLSYRVQGRAKMYHIPDVARNVMLFTVKKDD